jgi:hypothetical protein
MNLFCDEQNFHPKRDMVGLNIENNEDREMLTVFETFLIIMETREENAEITRYNLIL